MAEVDNSILGTPEVPAVLPEELLESSPIFRDVTDSFFVGGMQPTTNSDPEPFDMDSHFNSSTVGTPMDEIPDTRSAFSSVLQKFTDPFLAQGYNSVAALNRGSAAFFAHLDSVAAVVERTGIGQREGLFENLARTAEESADYWKDRADKVGINFVDEVISEAIGGAVPGITQFVLDVASGYTFPFAAGAQEAAERGEDSPIAAGILEAAKTGVLHHLFKAIAPLKQYLRGPTMGTVFGIEGAEAAPEGEKGKAFVKGLATGIGYSLTSPGGRLGLNDIVKGVNSQMPRLIKGERGTVDVPGAVKKEVPAGAERPEDLVRSQPVSDRRQGPVMSAAEQLRFNAFNKPVKELTVEEARYALEFDKLTGIKSRRSFDDIPKDHKFSSIDADGLKWVNDNISPNVGDAMLSLIGNAMQSTKLKKNAFHISGDEFYFTHPDVKVLDRANKDMVQYLKDRPITAILRKTGEEVTFTVGVSRGIAESKSAADIRLKENKAERAALGRRSRSREEAPPSLSTGIGRRGGVGDRRKEVRPPVEIEGVEPPFAQKPGEQKGSSEPTRPRKFLKTATEAASVEPELKAKLEAVDPQTYTVQPNKESLAAVETRIKKEGLDKVLDHTLSDAPLTAEKGAAFITLMDRFQKAGDFERAVQVTEVYDAQLREAGRFIQAASMWNRLTPAAFIKWGNKQLDTVRKRYTFADSIFGRKPKDFTLSKEEQQEIMELHRAASKLADGPEKSDLTMQMIDVVSRKVPPSISEIFDAYRYQNMLSSPRTHYRNIGENLYNTMITRPVDVATVGAVDFIQSGLTGRKREAYVRDVPVYMRAAVNAIPNAMEAFKATWKLGNMATLEKPDIGTHAKTAFEKSRAQKVPKALTHVSRFMEACDKFNMALIGGGEMARLTKLGVQPAEAYKISQETAETYLYRARLDPKDPRLSYPSRGMAALGQILIDSRKAPVIGPIAKWYVPFITTPVNKSISMMEFSPLGLIRDPRTFAQKEVAAKALAGSIITGIGATMAYTNDTTWAAPTNQEEKKWFYASGRKPFSIRMGDTWVPYWYLGPHALAFATPAAVKHYYEQRPESMTDDGVDKILGLTEGMARFIGSQSSTQSIGSLFSALGGDIDYNFKSQTGFTVQQVIPGSAFVRYVNTIIDPVYRHPKGFIEQIEANIPVLSKNLDARMTPFLEESVRDPLNYFLPYDIGKVDPTFEALFPFKRFNSRQDFLNNKLEGINRRLRSGDIDVDESLKQHFKLFDAGPKVIEPLIKGAE